VLKQRHFPALCRPNESHVRTRPRPNQIWVLWSMYAGTPGTDSEVVFGEFALGRKRRRLANRRGALGAAPVAPLQTAAGFDHEAC
jgi:hypothetical protein